MSANGAVIAAQGLVVKRGRRLVLDGIDFEVPRGQITGLLGPSGCGKSTLMRSIVGVQTGVSGELSVLGESAGSRGLLRRVSYATQAASVYDDLTVHQNLEYFAKVLGAPRGDAERVAAHVGLSDYLGQRVESLSGGQRGRVSLAAALLGEPELVVLDEPTVGLDPVLRAELWQLFRDLAAGGTTLLVSSHVMDEALRCDRLLLMREGQLVADTTPSELLELTGTSDPEAAFLAIIEADSRAADSRAADSRAADSRAADSRATDSRDDVALAGDWKGVHAESPAAGRADGGASAGAQSGSADGAQAHAPKHGGGDPL